MQTYSLISFFFRSSHLFRPCCLQTYRLIAYLFNPRTCLGPVGCKPTASYRFFFAPRSCLGPVGCKPTASYRFFFDPRTCLGPAGCKPTASYRFFVRSSHLFRPCWLQTYSLISFLFNPHTLVWVLLVVNLQPLVSDRRSLNSLWYEGRIDTKRLRKEFLHIHFNAENAPKKITFDLRSCLNNPQI